MSGKLLAAGLIGLGCVTAAAAGGYVALRSNAADFQQAPATSLPAPAAAPEPAPADTPAPAADPVATPETPAAPPEVSRPRPTSKPETRNAAVRPAPSPAVPSPAPAAAEVAQPASQAPPPPVVPAPPPAVQTAPPPPPPPAPKYDEVVVAANSVLGVLLDSTISSETARVEDRVNARVSRDVLVDSKVAIPSGARLEGMVTLVERGGKFKDRPRLGIAFNTLVLADGTRVAIQTDTIFRDGASPSSQANTKVGGSAVVGAILGAMIGGKKGALAGSAAGAAGGAAAVAAGDRAEAMMTSGTPLTARLSAPVTLLIERNHP